MAPIKAQKLGAINCYQKSSIHQFLYSLILHALIALTCSLLCSYSYSFPSLYTIKHFLLISLPNSWSWVFNPRCLFIVVNFIVVFLIGESKLSSGKHSSPATELYDEYVERRRVLSVRGRPASSIQEKKEEQIILGPVSLNKEINAKRVEDHKEVVDHEIKEDFKECKDQNDIVADEKDEEEEEELVKVEIEKEEEEEVKGEIKEEEEEEEETGIPAEELNKRVEDFIARVNKQWCLEARF